MNTVYFLVQQTMFFSIPLLIVALGGMFSERSGVVNIALEGIMIMGAFSSILFINIVQSSGAALPPQLLLLLAVLIAAAVGVLVSMAHAYASINMKADQVISGTAINMFAPAFAIFAARMIRSVQQIPFSNTFRITKVPVLGDIPVLGPLLFQNTYITTYLGFAVLAVSAVVLYKTRFGLRLRACGVKVAKMSGRGLGHTGGTLDKIEAIPGCSVSLTQEAFFRQVNDIGIAVIGQTGNLAPADKKMYALRDVTATVSCIPLIASSIMSKKLASGADCILLDVKTGNGAFMKTLEDSIALAKAMVDIGEHNGRRTAALITDMDTPLGRNIGNSLEVIEAVEALRGKGPADLTEVCLSLASGMLWLAGRGGAAACRAMAEDALRSGAALAKLRAMVAAQGGDPAVIDDPSGFPAAAYEHDVVCMQDGWLYATDTEKIGIAAVLLGAGRETKESVIDPAAGIRLLKKAGDPVKKGDVLARLYAGDAAKFAAAEEKFHSALTFAARRPQLPALVLARVDKDGVTRF